MADEQVQATDPIQESTPSAVPSAPAQPSTPAAQSVPSTPSGGSSAPAAAPPAAGVSQPNQSWLQDFKKDIPDLPDNEVQAREFLAQQYRDARTLRPLAPYVSEYQAKAADFQKWQAQQQAAPPAKAPDDWKKQFWNPPEYNPAWEKALTTDASGNISVLPGNDPGILNKFMAHRQHVAEVAQKLTSDPIGFLEGPIKHLARQMAQEEVQKNLGTYQNSQQAQTFTERNANWLFEQDNGQTKYVQEFNPQTGQYASVPVMSPWGQRFQAHAAEMRQKQEQRKYFDHQEIVDYALMRVQNEYYAGQVRSQAQPAAIPQQTEPTPEPQSPRQQANGKFLEKNNPTGKRGSGPNSNPATQPVNRLNFFQEAKKDLEAAGITDEIFKKSLR